MARLPGPNHWRHRQLRPQPRSRRRSSRRRRRRDIRRAHHAEAPSCPIAFRLVQATTMYTSIANETTPIATSTHAGTLNRLGGAA